MATKKQGAVRADKSDAPEKEGAASDSSKSDEASATGGASADSGLGEVARKASEPKAPPPKAPPDPTGRTPRGDEDDSDDDEDEEDDDSDERDNDPHWDSDYVVAPGKSITSKRSILGPGDAIAPRDVGGMKRLAELIGRGIVVECD